MSQFTVPELPLDWILWGCPGGASEGRNGGWQGPDDSPVRRRFGDRVGREGGIQFWGASTIIDPNGQVLARGSHDEEEIVLAACQLEQIEATRTHWPFLRDRRIDAYRDLNQRYLDDP